jgi:hypothetical protein
MMTKIQFSKEPKVDSLRPIGDDRRYAEAHAKLAKFQDELRRLREAIDRENARWYAAQQPAGGGDAIEIADRMIDGRTIPDDQDSPAKLAKLERKIEVLRLAIAKQSEIVDRLRGELSVEAARLVQVRHRKALVKILDAARALVAAANAERGIRAELLDLGFEVLDSILPAPRLAAPLILGDENFHDSAIAYFVRQLGELGLSHDNAWNDSRVCYHF